VTGVELQQPYLLLGIPLSLELDSLGRYYEPPLTYSQGALATKMLMYWRFYDSLEVVVLGSSQALWGFDPSLITGLKALNMAASAADLLGQKKIILNYLIKHSPNIKVICSSIDIGWLNESPDGNHTWNEGFGQSKGYVYDSCHEFWPAGVTKNLIDIIKKVPIPLPKDTENMGFAALPSYGWGGDPPWYYDSTVWEFTDSNCQENLAAISMLADTLRSRGIHWIMINFPISPYYKYYADYNVWGTPWQTARDVLLNLRTLDIANNFFHFYDANRDGNHDYSDDDAADYGHLSGQGAAKLSRRVDSIIHTILR
jgi:hypothetical protein